MNKIFKVIWSKSKQCYVVVSEMAKNTTGKKKIVVASILAGLAMSTMGTHVMAVSTIPFTDQPSSALANGSVKNTTTNGVAIGNAAYSDSNQSIAIGFRSFASGTFIGGSIKPSVAVGAGAHAEGNNTVAIGTIAENRASYGVALGNESKVTSGSDYGIAIGYQTQVSAVHSMAIGEKASASATLAVALGANAKATGAYSYTAGFNSESGGEAAIAVGKSASAGGESAVAVGNGTVATAGDAVAIGTSSQATGGDSIALGKSANASNGDSIAIGQDTVSNNINSVALGKTSQATGASATALGPQAKATGSTAVAIGLNSEANQSSTVAIGQSSAASGLQAIAVGYKSAASGENAAAYGNTAKAAEKNSLALGANTQATVEGGVALGAGSIANTVAGAGYNPNTGRTNTFTGLSGNALTSTWAAVSIGDGTNTRQLTGLAAGTNNTDAVNVAQLKSMNLAFTADGSTKGDVNLTNSALNVVGDSTYITTKGNNQTLTISGKKQTITVTNGTASASAGMADANNVAQAINQANADQTISYKANGGTANTVKVSDGLNFTNGTTTVATIGANGQVTYDLNTTTKQSITDSSTAVNRTIALGGSTGSTTAKKLASGDVKFNIKGQTGTNALISTSASGDDVTIAPTSKLTAAVTAAENAADKNLSNISTSGKTVIKDLAKGAAQDAVKVAGTGLATVSDNTTGGVKTYTVDVNTGNLVVTANGQVGAAGTTGASGAAGSNGVATTQNVATAINDAVTKAKASTTQALADAEHKFAGDTGTTSIRKHGEVLSIKGGVTTPADLSTGNIGVVSDGAGTLNIRLAKVLSGLTSATFTTAGGNTTVINGDGVTITPSGTGASAISMTTDGINAGGTEIKNIADGTAATSAVSKGQMETAIANAQTAATSTEKVIAKALTGDTNLATVTGQTGTAKGETYEVSVSENAVKNVAKAAAQDAVTVTGTGLATVSDNTAAGVKTYTVNVDEGKLVIDDTTGKVGAAGSTQGTTAGKNGVATTQNVATAINDAVTKANANNAQALADAKHNFAGDDATVISRKHGEQLNIKGGASTTATDLTSGNIAVVGDTASGTLNIKMAKALTGLTSATFTDGSGNTQTVTGGSSTISDAAGNSTVVSKGGVTTTDAAGNITTTAPTGVTVTPAGTGTTPISVTTSGISAGNKEIKNIANGTTDDAAVNKKQMDDAVKAASDATKALGDNTVSLGSESGSTTAKKLSTTGGITFNIKGDTGANALITTSATGDNVTIAPTAKLTAAVTAAEKSADKDLSNLSTAGDTYIKNLAKTAASWNVETNGGGTTAVAGGESVNFINGDNIAITNAGRAITIGTAKNVSFDKVTVGGIVLDKTNGINAGGKEVKGIADGTAADSAVSKGQMETAIANAQTAATSTEKVVAKTLSGDTNLATVTGQTGTAKGETYEVAVSENAVKNVAKAAAQDAVTVTGTGLATVSDNTTGGVKTYTVNVDEGKLVLDDTTGKIGANGATQGSTAGKNGVATTQNVATAINDAVTKANANNAQALADAKHNFAGDDATIISRKHGEQLNIKGGASTTATDLTSGNIAVVGDTASGTLNIKMAKALTGLTSATFTDGSGNT
ncbi:ESPR-type extended signal peptide-containing protein [Veillonella atypica]|uniref:ESPR-type extended signal peptide-containing protein n=1 Tax=Veillonella atypica TaxID=39777 RepID=UPI003AB84C30